MIVPFRHYVLNGRAIPIRYRYNPSQ